MYLNGIALNVQVTFNHDWHFNILPLIIRMNIKLASYLSTDVIFDTYVLVIGYK